MSSDSSHGPLVPAAIAAMGVVYGDIGTSPLYTMKEVFNGPHAVAADPANVLGILSLVFWALTITVTLKYVLFITRADNRGEGGIMALTSLAQRSARLGPQAMWLLTACGIFGAALFYGDAVLTPALSVLSAIEGLEVATPAFKPYIVPIALGVLLALFLFQRGGTERVARLFGPVMLFWFASLGALGLWQVLAHPQVLAAVNPAYAFEFFVHNRMHGFLALGAVVLAITGGEALYADMGHFGRRPLAAAWISYVFPLLYLNYLGQGALILAEPEAVQNPFFHMAPDALLYPLVALATAATIIASQAVISGAFSLTAQAMQLGYCPRIRVRYTSAKRMGQIYVPNINWLLLAAVVFLVLAFRSSSGLASAYGIAVTLTMLIDTLLATVVAISLWRWGLARALLFLIGFAAVDIAFFSANIVKVLDGGWFPLLIGAVVFTLLATWKRGRALLYERLKDDSMPLDGFIAALAHGGPQRVEGTGIFMTPDAASVPRALLHNMYHNKVLHQRVVLMEVNIEDVPYVPDIDQIEIRKLPEGFWHVTVRYGFNEEPNIPEIMERCDGLGLPFEMMETSFFLGRETIIPSREIKGMAYWREVLFMWMFRNADSATAYFKIPSNRVIELGAQVQL